MSKEDAMSDMEIPEGEPTEEWTSAQLDAYAEREGIGPLSGKKAEKVEQIAFAKAEPVVVDRWADASLTVPVGAVGATVRELRKALGLDDGLDRYDARMKSRVRVLQRRAGIPETGVIDTETRSLLI